jgi:hypothetical protein
MNPKGRSNHLLQDLRLSSMPSKIIPSSIIIRHKFRSRIDAENPYYRLHCRGQTMGAFKGTGFSKRNPHDRLAEIWSKGVQAQTHLRVAFLTLEMIYG